MSAWQRVGSASGASSPFALMAVRRSAANRRSAIAANPSPAILARFGADCLEVEAAELPSGGQGLRRGEAGLASLESTSRCEVSLRLSFNGGEAEGFAWRPTHARSR